MAQFRLNHMTDPPKKKLARIMLNLLETLTKRKRQSIKNRFSKHKKSLSSYQDVADYIQHIPSPTTIYGLPVELTEGDLDTIPKFYMPPSTNANQ